MKNKLKTGDTITCKLKVKTYNGKEFVSGNTAVIKSFPPKVQIVQGEGYDEEQTFIFCVLRNGDFVGLNFINTVKTKLN